MMRPFLSDPRSVCHGRRGLILGAAAIAAAAALPDPAAAGLKPALQAALLGRPTRLPKFRQGLINVRAGYSRCKWAFVGDSVTVGWGSNGAGGGAGANPGQSGTYRRDLGVVGEIGRVFNAMGIPCRWDAFFGTGHAVSGAKADADAANTNLSLGSGWIIYNAQEGAGGELYQSPPGDTTSTTFTPDYPTDRFTIFHTTFSTGGTVTVTDSGGTLATINSAGATGSTSVTVTRAVSSTDPISIQRTGVNNDFYLCGIVPFDSKSPRLELWDAGRAGWQASNWNDTAFGWSPGNELAIMAPDIFTIELGLNEAFGSVSGSTFQSNMQTLIGRCKATLADVHLIKSHVATGYDIATYWANFSRLWENNFLPPPTDHYNGVSLVTGTDRYDAVHLTNAGYAKKAAFQVADMLSKA